MNRVADLAEDRKNAVPGTGFVDRHARALTWAAVALLVLSFPALHLLLPRLTIPRLLFQLIGLAYNYRILPGDRLPTLLTAGRRGWTRFKELWLLKNTSSAVLFLLSCLVYPAALSGWAVPLSRLLWLAAFFFPLELTYEIIYDLRDVEGDRSENVPTFPVAQGEQFSHRLIEALLAASAAALVLGFIVGPLRFRELVLLGGVIQQAIFFRLRARTRVPTQADCVFVTYLGAAQVLSYNVWIWAGLPIG